MKKLSITFIALLVTIFTFGYAKAETINTNKDHTITKNMKILIAYYSYSGNVETLAKEIQNKVGGELFKIEINHDYSEDYKTMGQQAKKEIADGFLPQLKNKITNISDYDVIFIGSPNWWGTITPAVSSFLKQHNLKNKIVIPFISNASYGKQRTIDDLTKNCTNCSIQEALIATGNRTSGIDSWLKKIGFQNIK